MATHSQRLERDIENYCVAADTLVHGWPAPGVPRPEEFFQTQCARRDELTLLAAKLERKLLGSSSHVSLLLLDRFRKAQRDVSGLNQSLPQGPSEEECPASKVGELRRGVMLAFVVLPLLSLIGPLALILIFGNSAIAIAPFIFVTCGALLAHILSTWRERHAGYLVLVSFSMFGWLLAVLILGLGHDATSGELGLQWRGAEVEPTAGVVFASATAAFLHLSHAPVDAVQGSYARRVLFWTSVSGTVFFFFLLSWLPRLASRPANSIAGSGSLT